MSQRIILGMNYNDYRKLYMRNWRVKNGEKVRASMRKHNQKRRQELLAVLGEPLCKNCGFSDVRALQVDHINGDGHNDRRIMKRYSAQNLMKLVMEKPDNYQLLCANCNWIKRNEKKEYNNGGRPRKSLKDL